MTFTKTQKSTLKVNFCNLFIKNQYFIIEVSGKRVDVRNGSKNMSTWSNTLKYNLCDIIKKLYHFPDLEVACPTKHKKSSHCGGIFLFKLVIKTDF